MYVYVIMHAGVYVYLHVKVSVIICTASLPTTRVQLLYTPTLIPIPISISMPTFKPIRITL